MTFAYSNNHSLITQSKGHQAALTEKHKKSSNSFPKTSLSSFIFLPQHNTRNKPKPTNSNQPSTCLPEEITSPLSMTVSRRTVPQTSVQALAVCHLLWYIQHTGALRLTITEFAQGKVDPHEAGAKGGSTTDAGSGTTGSGSTGSGNQGSAKGGQ